MLLSLLSALAHAQITPDPAQLLDTLRAEDAAYESGVTFTGTAVLPPPWQSHGVGPSTVQWTLTCSSDRSAYREETVTPPELTYVEPPPGPREAGSGSYDPDGRMIVDFPLVATYMLGRDFSGMRQDDAVYALTPQTKAMVSNSSHMVLLDQPDKMTLLAHRPLYCAGRGFTRYIDEITVAEETKEGLVVAKATGTFGQHGVWRITVDPKAGYIIRSAEFTPGDSWSPSFKMSNTGTKWAGAYSIPEQGSVTIDTYIWDAATAYIFDSARAGADTELLDAVENDLKPPFPPSTNVIDSRVFPPTTYFVRAPSADDVREKAVTALAPPLDEDANEPVTQDVAPVAQPPAATESPTPAPPAPSNASPRSLSRRAPIFVVLAVLLAVGAAALLRKRRLRR